MKHGRRKVMKTSSIKRGALFCKTGTCLCSNKERWVQQTTVYTKITFKIQFTKTTIIIIVIITIINTIVSETAIVLKGGCSGSQKSNSCHFNSTVFVKESLINQKINNNPEENLSKIDSRSKNNLQK